MTTPPVCEGCLFHKKFSCTLPAPYPPGDCCTGCLVIHVLTEEESRKMIYENLTGGSHDQDRSKPKPRTAT